MNADELRAMRLRHFEEHVQLADRQGIELTVAELAARCGRQSATIRRYALASSMTRLEGNTVRLINAGGHEPQPTGGGVHGRSTP